MRKCYCIIRGFRWLSGLYPNLQTAITLPGMHKNRPECCQTKGDGLFFQFLGTYAIIWSKCSIYITMKPACFWESRKAGKQANLTRICPQKWQNTYKGDKMWETWHNSDNKVTKKLQKVTKSDKQVTKVIKKWQKVTKSYTKSDQKWQKVTKSD